MDRLTVGQGQYRQKYRNSDDYRDQVARGNRSGSGLTACWVTSNILAVIALIGVVAEIPELALMTGIGAVIMAVMMKVDAVAPQTPQHMQPKTD